MAARRAVVGDILPTFVSPQVVRDEIRKTQAFIRDLSNEVVKAYADSEGKRTPEQEKWFADYPVWRKRFEDWATSNLNDPWGPLQTLATSSIANQNDAWRKEAVAKQEQLRALGFTSSATPPPLSPGQAAGGDFLSGVGTGTVLGALLLAWALSQDSGGRRGRR
jgi:hypothetical protein